MEEIYINFSRCGKIEGNAVTVKDAATVWCSDAAVRNKVNTIKLYDFAGKTEKRVIISALKIIEEIDKEIKGVRIVPTGESDVIIEQSGGKKPELWFIYAKVALICLIIFFGSAFTIMAFNNDVAVHDVFGQYYKWVTGNESDGFTLLEICYSIGLAVGILIFYNHFGAKRLSKDPTPIEVEMRKYENDINNTLIDGIKRKGAHMDVD